MMTTPNQQLNQHQHLNQLLSDSGVSKIIYALVMPETEQTIDAVLDGENKNRPVVGRAGFHHRFREAWTQKQDAMHEGFFHTWKEWTAPIVELDKQLFPFCYPTAGASEALRESIHAYGARARKELFNPKIHTFEGEYEGFGAYAAAASIELQTHRRKDWPEAISAIGPNDQFYISQPSAVDGMVWDAFEIFATELARQKPTAELMLDLSYVGCVAREFTVNANHPNIAAVFLSLSKPAGVYYHRVGGMFSRQEYPGLFGNKWFKNLTSLSIGTEFMSRFGVHELPRKYSSIQQIAIDKTNEKLQLNLRPADIFLLAIGDPSAQPSDLERYLMRGPIGQQRVRVGLTPLMAHEIDPSLSPSVSARYYERFPERIEP